MNSKRSWKILSMTGMQSPPGQVFSHRWQWLYCCHPHNIEKIHYCHCWQLAIYSALCLSFCQVIASLCIYDSATNNTCVFYILHLVKSERHLIEGHKSPVVSNSIKFILLSTYFSSCHIVLYNSRVLWGLYNIVTTFMLLLGIKTPDYAVFEFCWLNILEIHENTKYSDTWKPKTQCWSACLLSSWQGWTTILIKICVLSWLVEHTVLYVRWGIEI